MRSRSGAAGVTLIEILVVITILSVIGAVVFPSVAAGLDTLRLKSAADRLANTFRFARERALRRQVICQVTVDPERRVVEIQDFSPERYHRSFEVPQEITLRMERARTFVFTPDGGAPHIAVTLENSRGRIASVEFDVLTALPRVELGR